MPSIPTTPTKAANKARAVKAAEAIAKPLPVAAVVLPTASRVSVFSGVHSFQLYRLHYQQ
jgi:hypothetical protein